MANLERKLHGDGPRRRPRSRLGEWILFIACLPLLAACAALLAHMVLAGATGSGGARFTGFVEDGRYYVMAGKPPAPLEVSAWYWRADYAAQTVMLYGILVTLTEVAAAVTVTGVWALLTDLWRGIRRFICNR